MPGAVLIALSWLAHLTLAAAFEVSSVIPPILGMRKQRRYLT